MHFENFGLVGQQLLNALIFRKYQFRPGVRFIDPVTQEKVTGSVLFTEHRSGRTVRWLMRGESLPGYIAVKAIGVDAGNLYIETALISQEDVLRLAVDCSGAYFDDQELRVRSYDKKTLFAITEHRDKNRCLWTMPLEKLCEDEQEKGIGFLDTVVIEEAFEKSEGAEEAPSGEMVQAMLLRLNLNMVQMLELEQRPMLMVDIHQGGYQEMSQIQALFMLQRMILRMSGDELIQFLSKDLSREGQERALRILHFVISGKVKKIRAELDWKQARAIAWKLIHRPSAPVVT